MVKNAIVKVLLWLKHILWEIKRFGGFFYRTAEELIKAGWKRRNSRYARYYKYMRLKEDTVLFESFFGRGMLCNPYALFKSMLHDPDYKDMKFIWVLDEPADHQKLIHEYSSFHNVRFVKYLSRGYLKALSSAKYLINNVTFPSFFTKKEGQVYINTWHGIPLKKLGYDMVNGVVATNNIIRNFLQTDYLISANPFLTEIYKTAYKLDGIFEGTIVEEGYPRLDTLLIDSPEILKKLESVGVRIDKGKKIILYAPTWKENEHDPLTVINEYTSLKNSIEQVAPEYQVLIKVHQFVYQLIKSQSGYDYIIPATIDANEVLPIADILISDYSSIFYDYVFLDKPILFYIPDLEEYESSRGLYIGIEDLPGPCTKDINELLRWINKIDAISDSYKEKVTACKNWCCSYDVGNISKNILELTIKGNQDNHRFITGLDNNKKKILLHRGGMLVNGITTSFINLLKQIDYSKFDITVYITDSKKPQEQALINAIDSRARVIVRNSTFNGTFLESVKQKMLGAYGPKLMQHFLSSNYFKREVQRCFGDSHFDAAVDFEGYNLFDSIIVLNTKSKLKAIWQHNDMQKEYESRFSYLGNIFELYPRFDKIVSCSKAIMEVNRSNLSTEKTYNKYSYAKNLIDFKRILSLTNDKKILDIDGERYLIIKDGNREDFHNGKLLKLARNTCFISIGRLSPEKNYINLVEAFHKLIEDGYDATYYILGEGKQRGDIEDKIKESELSGKIILTGNVANPYAILKECDCFVLPSLYEGQPMVILEARILNKPILMTEFSSSAGSVIKNGQTIIGMDVEGIYKGLKDFMDAKITAQYSFNPEQYNQEAYLEFLNAIDMKED